jgi:hypothetical protein
MMPSLLIIHVQSLERATAADKAAKLERCKLGGTTDIKPKTREDPDTRAKFEDAGLDPVTASKWQLGAATDIKPKTREDPDMRAKFEDAGLDPARASKWQLGGTLGGTLGGIHRSNSSQSQPKTHGKCGSKDECFEGILDKKNFAKAADARAHGYCIAKGCNSKKTGITPWRLIKTNGTL